MSNFIMKKIEKLQLLFYKQTSMYNLKMAFLFSEMQAILKNK